MTGADPSSWLPAIEPGLGALAFGAALAWGCGRSCGYLKLERGWGTGYTRKLFHFAIFSIATALQALWGLPLVLAFASGVVGVLLWALWRADGHPIYEAVAREQDAPRRGLFVAVPLAATALGGLLSNWAVGEAALVGYLVTGWGDAAGEPVGRWLGRHPYRVPSLGGVASHRTWEGSAAIAAVGSIAACLALTTALELSLERALPLGALVGIATALVEAVSPHGLDNLTTMLAASAVAGAGTSPPLA